MHSPILLFTRLSLIVLLIGACLEICQAQDAQFSQFFANPLYQNPAFAGATGMNRVAFNYRIQWPALAANYQTVSGSYDRYFEKIRSGIGLQVWNDTQGFGGLSALDIGLHYAYQLKLSDRFTYRHGLQVSYSQRSGGYAALTFGTQFNPNTQTFTNPSGEVLGGGTRIYPDISTGGLFYDRNLFFAYSVHHLTQPNQSVTPGVRSVLPLKIEFQLGYKIRLAPKPTYGRARDPKDEDLERSFTPVLLYKQQGPFNQLDLGGYLTLEPLVVGLMYRGLPIRPLRTEGLNNHDAAVALVGLKMGGLNIGYSYDLTISNLGVSTGGAHEISIVYIWQNEKRPKPSKYNPCPLPTF
jgi:type IX secretion system PorP/SprF family membrane protein